MSLHCSLRIILVEESLKNSTYCPRIALSHSYQTEDNSLRHLFQCRASVTSARLTEFSGCLHPSPNLPLPKPAQSHLRNVDPKSTS